MKVFDSNFNEIRLNTSPFSKGGEGAVYKISAPSQYSYACVKIYHEQQRTSERKEKLLYMVANKPKVTASNAYLICWPIDLVYNKAGYFCGFIMPLAFNNSIELYELCRLKLNNKLSKVWHDKFNRNKVGIINRLKLMQNLAIPLHLIHQTNHYVIVDFKPQNILIDSTGKVSLIDIDSIQIETGQNKTYCSQVSTPEYCPPEVINRRATNRVFSVNSDLFALAIIYYQILFGLHPFTVTPFSIYVSSYEVTECISNKLFPYGHNAKKVKIIPPPHSQFLNLPIELKRLFILSFEEESMRATAEMWGKILNKIINQIDKIK